MSHRGRPPLPSLELLSSTFFSCSQNPEVGFNSIHSQWLGFVAWD